MKDKLKEDRERDWFLPALGGAALVAVVLGAAAFFALAALIFGVGT